MTISKVNFLHCYQKVKSTAITIKNVLSAWWAAELVSYDSSIITSNLSQLTTSFFTFFTNFNEVQINITVTPHTATQINQFVNEVLTDMTLSLYSHVLSLKNTVLTAVMNRAVLWQTNQKLLEKQQQWWKKQSQKAVENAWVLTVNENKVIMQKEQNRAKEMTIKSARYHALRGKVEFVKLVWKKMAMNYSVFM